MRRCMPGAHRDARTSWWRSGACLAHAGTHAQVGGAAGHAWRTQGRTRKLVAQRGMPDTHRDACTS